MNNPWAGLASYQDPAAGSTLLFCGRDNESYDLAALVDDNIFCTLYGKSGTGKTSLLNAGVFPRLRAMGYLPVSIRLGMEAMDTTFQQCIASRLGQTATLETTDTVVLPADDQDEQWLWAWFARTRFVDGEGKRRFAVLVFDQFEEVFRRRRGEAEALLRQIHFMMDPSHTLGESYDYNFRFLASIREDDLYLLEDSLDRNFVGDMKQCRYRLNALTDEGARDVILKPGKGLFAEGEQDEIVNTIIDIARSADGSINTNILSLVCSRIYEEYRHSGARSISLELVRGFVSGNPFEQFYNEVTRDLGEKEKRFIEDRLVDAAGRRGSVSEPDFEKNVPNGAHLLEGTGRILQRVASGTESRSYRIELIHDSFCAPLADQKMKRAARRRRRITIAVSVVALVIAAVAAWIVIMSVRNARQTREILIQQERFYAKQASQLLDEGDTYTALLLLNELTDPDGSFAKIPLQPEAEYQMRRAVQMYDNSEWKNVSSYRLNGIVRMPPQITPNGKYLLVSITGGIIVFDSTGKYVKKITTGTFNSAIPFFTVSHDSKKVAYQDYDEINYADRIGIVEIESEDRNYVELESLTKYISTGYHPLSQMVFSLDDKYIIALMDTCRPSFISGMKPYKIKAIEINHGEVEWIEVDGWGVEKRKSPKKGEWGLTEYDFDDSQVYGIENGNLDGRRLAARGIDDIIRIYDIKTGEILYSLDAGKIDTYKYLNDEELLFMKGDKFMKYSVSTKRWTSLMNKKVDMTRMDDIQITKHQFMVSNRDTLFLYGLEDGNLECTYVWDTTKFSYPTLCADSTILMVDARKGRIIKIKYEPSNRLQLAGYEDAIDDLSGAWQSEDGSLFVSMNYGVFTVMDIRNGDTVFYDTTTFQRDLEAVSCDGKKVLVKHWNPIINSNGDTIWNTNDDYEDIPFFRDYHLFDIEKKQWVHTFDTSELHANALSQIFFSLDSKSVLYRPKQSYSQLKKYNISSGEIEIIELDTTTESNRYFYNFDFSNNVCSRNNDVIIVHSSACDKIWTFNTRNYAIKQVSEESFQNLKYCPNGKKILGVTCGEGDLVVFNSNFEEEKRVHGMLKELKAVSLDNLQCIVVTREGKLELWSISQLKRLGPIVLPYPLINVPMSFTPDGKNIVYYSYAITEEGKVGFVRVPIPSQEEIKIRVRQLAGSRKLTAEEKSMLLE